MSNTKPSKATSDYKIAAKWAEQCRELMKLSDWSIELTVADDPPPWCNDGEEAMGTSLSFIALKKAQIWVSPQRTKAAGKDGSTDSYNIGSTIVHEMLHVFFDDVGETQSNVSESFHGIVYTLESLLMDGGITL